MKIMHIYGNMSHHDLGLNLLVSRVRDVFSELGVDNGDVDLGKIHPPHYDGETTNSIDSVVENIREAKGLVLACTAQLYAPTALMQSFLEYLEHPEYNQALDGKHCLLISLSQNGGEKSALDYLARVIHHLGGFVVAQIGLQSHHMAGIEDSSIGDFIDKTAEHFYRSAHQGRNYVVPRDYSVISGVVSTPPVVDGTRRGSSSHMVDSPAPLVAATASNHLSHAPAHNVQVKPIYLNSEHEKDIDEISMLISQKFSDGDDPESVQPRAGSTHGYPGVSLGLPEWATKGKPRTPAPASPPSPSSKLASEPPSLPIEHRAKTAKQITQSLPLYFQPQLSAGMQSVIQINITGEETFEGYLYIHNTECTYSEGSAPAPDVIIMADSTVWMDVLKSKHTAQKAFMIGGLKVRGDFVLLTKFDTLFKLDL